MERPGEAVNADVFLFTSMKPNTPQGKIVRMGKEALAFSYVRFSSRPQEKGDSVRRQVELAERWSAKNGVKLSGLTLHDLGVSAYKGDNKLKGSLAHFLRLAHEQVEVIPGDFFLVEHIDRISRQAAEDSLDTIRELVKAGIRIVDLNLGGEPKIIDKDALKKNPFILMELLLKFILAHEESEKKAKRTNEARAEARKRLETTGAKIKQRLPAWIRWNDDRSGFVLDPVRSAIMRRIVSMAMEGIGAFSIQAILNSEGVPPISDRVTTANYEYSTIQMYLRSRILIGEFQPMVAVEGKRRQPAGEPHKNYYPALLTEDEFYALQARLDIRATGKRQGREGKTVANLFGRLLVNGYDKGTMTLGNKRKNKSTMQSMNANRGLAQKCSFPYNEFEQGFLKWVSEIEVENKRDQTTSKLDERLGKLSNVVGKIAKLQEKLIDDDGSESDTIADALKNLGKIEKTLKEEIANEKIAAAAPQVKTSEVVSISTQLRNAKGKELQALRSRLKLAIASVVERVDIFPCEGGSNLIRHAGCVVALKNGLVRSYQLRVERDNAPITGRYVGNGEAFDPSAKFDDLDQYRKLIGRMTKVFAGMSYADFKADFAEQGCSIVALPWG